MRAGRGGFSIWLRWAARIAPVILLGVLIPV